MAYGSKRSLVLIEKPWVLCSIWSKHCFLFCIDGMLLGNLCRVIFLIWFISFYLGGLHILWDLSSYAYASFWPASLGWLWSGFWGYEWCFQLLWILETDYATKVTLKTFSLLGLISTLRITCCTGDMIGW